MKLLTWLLLLIPIVSSAQVFGNPADYERVLVPVLLQRPVAGAFGSQWVTEFVARNSSSERVQLLFGPPECNITCVEPPFTYLEPMRTHTEATFFFSEHPSSSSNVGALLSLQKSASSSVAFGLRVADLSRQALTRGTEIPVVRENDLFLTTLTLPSVPVDGRSRLTLRIYDVDAKGDAVATVRVFERDSNQVINEQSVILGSTYAFGNPDYPRYPGYAEISELTGGRTGNFRLEISPVTAGLRFWAFVSITNNETQHVTTVTPH